MVYLPLLEWSTTTRNFDVGDFMYDFLQRSRKLKGTLFT